MKTIVFILCIGLTLGEMFGQVGIGTVNPTNSSMLEVSSTSDGGATYKGFMPPRVLTVTERDAIYPNYSDYGLIVFVANNGSGQGCLQIWDGDSWEDINCITVAQPVVWVNEFHYNNIGTDVGEFIEVAGLAGTDLSTYSIVLYSGTNGQAYNTRSLSGIISSESNGYGTVSFNYNDEIRNTTHGIALVNSGIVVQFLSYSGSFTATDGPAVGMDSEDILENENQNTPIGESVQLTGTGNQYSNFIWNAPADDSPGALNVGQIIN